MYVYGDVQGVVDNFKSGRGACRWVRAALCCQHESVCMIKCNRLHVFCWVCGAQLQAVCCYTRDVLLHHMREAALGGQIVSHSVCSHTTACDSRHCLGIMVCIAGLKAGTGVLLDLVEIWISLHTTLPHIVCCLHRVVPPSCLRSQLLSFMGKLHNACMQTELRCCICCRCIQQVSGAKCWMLAVMAGAMRSQTLSCTQGEA